MTTREQNLYHVTPSTNDVKTSKEAWCATRDAMADLAPEGPHYLESLDLEEEVEERVLRYHRRQLEEPVPQLHYLEYDVDEHLVHTTVPEPIRIRGVGGTTMSVIYIPPSPYHN